MMKGNSDGSLNTIADRLRAARSQANLTQDQAAQALGVVRTTLVAMEKGQRRVRPDELEALAALYGVSMNWLLRQEAVAIDLSARFRALSKAGQDARADAIRLLNTLVAAELELERLVESPLRTDYPAERPLGPGPVDEQAEDMADGVRQRLGLGHAPIEDIVTLLELELGIRVFVRPIDSRVSGLFAFDEQAGACMLLNRKHWPQRRAMTAAHELGHFLTARGEVEIVEDTGVRASAREERFAARFAMAFLMPRAVIRRRFEDCYRDQERFSPRHLILMAHTFRVSPPAMCLRLEQLQLIPTGMWDELKRRGFSGETVRKVLGDQVRPEEPLVSPRLGWLVTTAYDRGLLTEGQLSRMLVLDRVEVREILDMFDSEETSDLESCADDSIAPA